MSCILINFKKEENSININNINNCDYKNEEIDKAFEILETN